MCWVRTRAFLYTWRDARKDCIHTWSRLRMKSASCQACAVCQCSLSCIECSSPGKRQDNAFARGGKSSSRSKDTFGGTGTAAAPWQLLHGAAGHRPGNCGHSSSQKPRRHVLHFFFQGGSSRFASMCVLLPGNHEIIFLVVDWL